MYIRIKNIKMANFIFYKERLTHTYFIIKDFILQNCKAGTAKCFDITCYIYNLQRKQEATITVKARYV